MSRWVWRSVRVRLSFAAFSATAALLGWTLWHAARPDQLTPPAPMADSVQFGPDAPGASGYSLERLLAAVAKDLFHPERRRPGARFQLPARHWDGRGPGWWRLRDVRVGGREPAYRARRRARGRLGPQACEPGCGGVYDGGGSSGCGAHTESGELRCDTARG